MLELHSNKANKKAVLDQLRKTADARMRNGSESWAGLNSQLRTKRKELNDFVTALHERSKFGISARQAISRVASKQHNSDLALDWGINLSDSKVANAEDVEKLLATAKDAGLRFTNLRHFDTGICSSIVATTWTFQWQIKFLESIGVDNVMKHEAELIEYGQELLQKNNSVKLIGNPKNKGGVLSFTIEGVHPHDIATILDEDGVAIRAGHHCCQILHDKLNIPASARASVGIYNTKEDLDQLNQSINNCKKIFNL